MPLSIWIRADLPCFSCAVALLCRETPFRLEPFASNVFGYLIVNLCSGTVDGIKLIQSTVGRS